MQPRRPPGCDSGICSHLPFTKQNQADAPTCVIMQAYEMNDFAPEVPSRARTWTRLTGSTRSSFDYDYFRKHACDISIWDDVVAASTTTEEPNSNDESAGISRHTIPEGPGASILSQSLRSCLESRDLSKTRWINIVGWSDALMNHLSESYLGNHGCLDLHDFSRQMLGGPVGCTNSGEFIWIQTSVWFLGDRNPNWSSIQQSGFRMVICMPTSSRAGTLITNFVGEFSLAREISCICTENVIENHSMGNQALGCVWILAFAVLRAIAEQVDFAFQTFDPIAMDAPSIPRIDDLPFMLEKANNLARIDRYISGLEESSSFFNNVRSFQHRNERFLSNEHSQAANRYNSPSVRERATLESSLAQQKITRAQKLCTTYLRQYESLVQMTISFGTSQITERLDSGRTLAEKFATIGVILAGVSGLTSPFALVIGYFGMNVREMVDGASTSLFDFWQIALPVLLLCIVGLGSLLLRLLSRPNRH